MNLQNRSCVVIAVAVLAGCSADPRLSSGLKVTVLVEPSSRAQCVRVIATPEQGSATPTRAIARKDEIVVAVYKGEDWSGKTTLVARGYASCTDDIPNHIEESAAVVKDALEGEVTLALKGTTPVVDNDGDGKRGADDCDDNDAQRFVGNAELCSSTKDNNCSNTVGCADGACTGACAPGGTCQAGVCIGSTELSCVDGQDNDNDQQVDCLDPDCFAASCNDNNACTSSDVCRGDGGCGGAPVQVTCGAAPTGTCLFGAGVCNPADGGCMYPARDAGLSCNDGNACTSGDVCLLDGGCNPGAPRVCNTPGSNTCLMATGQCLPADGGCYYPPDVNKACNDNAACTVNDVCQPDAGCRGAPKVCYQTANPCQLDAGSCNTTSGACSFPNVQNGTSCDDGNACTVTSCDTGACTVDSNVTCQAQDICHDAGTCSPQTGCSNPPRSCVPNECQTGGTCSVSANGCTYTNKPDNTACSIGACQSGVCTSIFTRFAYVPSNFNPDAGYANPATASAKVTIDCAATINTSGATPTFTGCAGKGSAVPVVIAQENGGTASSVEAVLVPFRELELSSSGTLTITGTRPVILAVFGQAVIDGVIEVGAAGAASGPGADLSCPTPPTNGGMLGDATTGATSGGSGAGAGANAGSGGNGADGDGNNANGLAGTGGSAADLRPLVGGCSGATGGSLANPGQRPKGGGGGGAVQLSVAGLLKMNSGKIYAPGGGGQGGAGATTLGLKGEGGGGGGAGGSILLEGGNISIDNNVILTANAGAGGEGGNGGTLGASGTNGPDGSKTLRVETVNSGNTASNGGAGGTGGGATTINGTAGTADNGGGSGGGGGGGGVGRIRLVTPGTLCRISGHVISPSTNSGGTNTGFSISAVSQTTSGCL